TMDSMMTILMAYPIDNCIEMISLEDTDQQRLFDLNDDEAKDDFDDGKLQKKVEGAVPACGIRVSI
ncbi:unnamed protein product, partial [Didymodactylos carnosus]